MREGTLKQRVVSEAKKGVALTIYFGLWFSALTLLTNEIMKEHDLPYFHWGFAWIKAGLCAKFILIGQAFYPMSRVESINKDLWRTVLPRSLVYLLLVLLFSLIETGFDGLMRGGLFVAAVDHFANGDPWYVFALSWVYWMILLPYLVLETLLKPQ